MGLCLYMVSNIWCLVCLSIYLNIFTVNMLGLAESNGLTILWGYLCKNKCLEKFPQPGASRSWAECQKYIIWGPQLDTKNSFWLRLWWLREHRQLRMLPSKHRTGHLTTYQRINGVGKNNPVMHNVRTNFTSIYFYYNFWNKLINCLILT